MQKTSDIPDIEGICGCKTQYESTLIYKLRKTFFTYWYLFVTTFRIDKSSYSLIHTKKIQMKIIVFFSTLKNKNEK